MLENVNNAPQAIVESEKIYNIFVQPATSYWHLIIEK